MDRFFRPKGGFANSPVDRIRIDADGNSYEVLSDGIERAAQVADHRQVGKPIWALDEVLRLVAGGSWEEVTEATPEVQKEPAPVLADVVAPAQNKKAESRTSRVIQENKPQE